jgi:T3SS negative regulator,GrlR
MDAPMIEGFWILKILPPPVTSGGVIMFTSGRIFGGDNAFTWVGTYSVTNTALKGRVRVHNFDPEIKSVLGVDGDYDMHFSGILSGDVITGTAMIANQPQHSLGLRMEKYAQI